MKQIVYPDKWAALAPIAAFYSPDPVKVAHIPTRVFHGGKDREADVRPVRALVEQLRKIGAPVEYKEYPEEGHTGPAKEYASNNLFDWFLSLKKE